MIIVKNLINNFHRLIGNYSKDKKIIKKNLKLYGQYASMRKVLVFISSKINTKFFNYEGTK